MATAIFGVVPGGFSTAAAHVGILARLRRSGSSAMVPVWTPARRPRSSSPARDEHGNSPTGQGLRSRAGDVNARRGFGVRSVALAVGWVGRSRSAAASGYDEALP